MHRPACVPLRAALVGCLMLVAGTAPAQDIEAFRSARDAYIDGFRRNGERSPEPLVTLEREMLAALEKAPAANRGALLFEIASVQRMQSRFEEAIATYQAALAADASGEVAFGAWIGIARAHAYGTKNHGAAEEALQHALEAAGPEPSRKQRYELADYLAQLQIARGEIEAALSNGLEANRLAATDDERYYAELDTGDALDQLAASCAFRRLVDARTFTDEADDGYGACRRAVAAAGKYYARSAETAARLGWDQMRVMSEEFRTSLGTRLFLIEQSASMSRMADARAFSAEDASDVLVNEEFSAGGEAIDVPEVSVLIGEAVVGAAEGDPRPEFLLGVKADIDGNAAQALIHFERAVGLLERERATHFDVRQRGTVVENRPELVRSLGLRLIALRSYERAFAAFESIRARGLGDLAAAYETQEFSPAERRWLAGLVDLESQESALLTDLAERAVAGMPDDPDRILAELAANRARQRAHARDPAFAGTLARLAATPREPVGLPQIKGLVRTTGVPVLFYWVTQTNVVVWAVSPKGTEVKSVFLPEEAVIDKVRRVIDSASSANQPFDTTAARQLYAYLVQPFERHLTGEEVIIVPQGPLVTLPFEALIDGRSGQFLVEKVAVSYAPSAAFAAKALQRDGFVLPPVTALYDEAIESDTGEVARLRGRLATGLEALPTQTLSADEAIDALGGHEALHVLLHGTFEQADPLQSHLSLANLDLSREDNAVTAGELLASDWRRARIVVFSSCESARMNVRISNEIYGLSWAPLAGGAKAVVTSRWRVLGPSNADWMEDFYGRLAAGGVSPAIASAGTMRRMIQETGADPYYWAGPQVFGR